MTYKDIMSRNDENMGWCMPVSFDNGRVVVMVENRYIEGIQIDGVDIYPTPDAVRDVSARIEKIMDDMCDDGEALPCRLCPWFDICDQMLEEFEPNADETA